MNSKERVLAALNHKLPDKVPMDFGSHGCSMMHVTCVQDLREYFGLKGLVKVADPSAMIGLIEDDLLDAMGCDAAGVKAYSNIFGVRVENWKEWDYFGKSILVPGGFNVTQDEKGGYFAYPQGDVTMPASAYMPVNGFYFDSIIRQEAFESEDDLDYRDNLAEFQPVGEEQLDFYRSEAERLKDCGRAAVVELWHSHFGNIGIVPAPMIAHPKGIRSIEEWYMAPLLYPNYIRKLFEEQTQIAIDSISKMSKALGDSIDVAVVCGSDFGTQTGTFISQDTFNEFWAPCFKRVNDWIHSNTNWKTMLHSCGAVFDFIPSFIESGFDILNPVQCSASGMDPVSLKREYGRDIVFWGGGVDTQKVLPFGKPDEIREQVLQRCEIFGEDGGFIFNAVHIVQCGTPVGNILAMINAVREFNGDASI